MDPPSKGSECMLVAVDGKQLGPRASQLSDGKEVWIYKQPLPTQTGFETNVRKLVVQQQVPMNGGK